MRTPWKFPRSCGGVLSIVLVASSCAERPSWYLEGRPPTEFTLRQLEASNSSSVTPEPASVTPEEPSLAAEAPSEPLRGRVLCRSTGEPLQAGTPLVVLAIPDAGAASASIPDSSPSQARVARFGGEASAPVFVVTSPGRGVRFENGDGICHGLFSSSGLNAFDLGVLNPGESRTVEFRQPGPVQIYCSLHTGKQMSLFVAPTSHHARVESDGSFELEGLPPGDYILEAWGPELIPERVRVTMPAPSIQPLLIHVNLEPAQ